MSKKQVGPYVAWAVGAQVEKWLDALKEGVTAVL